MLIVLLAYRSCGVQVRGAQVREEALVRGTQVSEAVWCMHWERHGVVWPSAAVTQSSPLSAQNQRGCCLLGHRMLHHVLRPGGRLVVSHI